MFSYTQMLTEHINYSARTSTGWERWGARSADTARPQKTTRSTPPSIVEGGC